MTIDADRLRTMTLYPQHTMDIDGTAVSECAGERQHDTRCKSTTLGGTWPAWNTVSSRLLRCHREFSRLRYMLRTCRRPKPRSRPDEVRRRPLRGRRRAAYVHILRLVTRDARGIPGHDRPSKMHTGSSGRRAFLWGVGGDSWVVAR